MAEQATAEQGVSERRACRILNLSRCAYRYQAKKTDDPQIEQELRQLAERRRSWGYGKMIDYLKHQGYPWNHKRIYRIYCDLALNLRRKPKKRLPARSAHALVQPAQANQSWSRDVMSDSLSRGRAFRTLNILEQHPRLQIRHLPRLQVDSYVLAAVDVHDNCWKESRGLADWVFTPAFD